MQLQWIISVGGDITEVGKMLVPVLVNDSIRIVYEKRGKPSSHTSKCQPFKIPFSSSDQTVSAIKGTEKMLNIIYSKKWN